MRNSSLRRVGNLLYTSCGKKSEYVCVSFTRTQIFFSVVQVHSLALLGAEEPKQTRAREREREKWAAAVGN